MPVILDARVVKGAGGGPDKTIINSPPHLAPHGYRMLCAYMHPLGDTGFQQLRAKAAERGTELLSIVDRGPLDWKVLRDLLQLCKRENVNVWHGHDYKSNLAGIVLKKFWPMRLVTTVHGWVHRTARTPLYYWLDRASLRFYEKVICVSDDLYQACRNVGVAASKCVLLENGVDVTDFRRLRSPGEARKDLGLPADGILIGAVGRLSAEKGFDLLIQAVDRLLVNGHDVRLAIFGEGVEKESLEKLIAQLGRQDRIHLMGYRPNVKPCFEAMDLFVLSSLREGLPNVVLEAMAMEVPVVSTRVAGVPRLIRHDVNGVLIEPGSVESLITGIEPLLTHTALRNRYRTEGRRTVEEHFSFASRMERLRRLYDEMVLQPTGVSRAMS